MSPSLHLCSHGFLALIVPEVSRLLGATLSVALKPFCPRIWIHCLVVTDLECVMEEERSGCTWEGVNTGGQRREICS